MKDIKGVFRGLEQKIIESKWFSSGWQIYNRGEYLQLYKTTWHNQNQGGIHFETYIETPQIKQKQFPICMHAEEDCPFQRFFIKRFLELEKHRIKSWKGYKIIDKDYHIFNKIMPLNFKNLEQRMFEEFNKLRNLEVSVEKALSSIALESNINVCP